MCARSFVVQAALTFDEFGEFVQEMTNLRLALADLRTLFDIHAVAGNGRSGGGSGNGVNNDDGRVVPLKTFITHFKHYTEERFTFLKSYILNPCVQHTVPPSRQQLTHSKACAARARVR